MAFGVVTMDMTPVLPLVTLGKSVNIEEHVFGLQNESINSFLMHLL